MAKINQSMKLFKIATRPQLSLSDFKNIEKLNDFFTTYQIDNEVMEQVEIYLKYSGYIDKEKNNADKLNRLENVLIPTTFNYQKVQSLFFRSKRKINKNKTKNHFTSE